MTPDHERVDTTPVSASPRPHLLLRAGLAAKEVRKRLRESRRLGDVGQRALAFYLVEVDERRLHQDTGHSSTVFFAECTLDLDRRRTVELLRVGRALLELPAIDAAFCAGELTWSRVLMLARVATALHEHEWLKVAREASCRELAGMVKGTKPGGRPTKRTKGLPEVRYRRGGEVDAITNALVEQAVAKLSAERGVEISEAEFMRAAAELIVTTREDGSVPGRTVVDDSLYQLVVQAGAADGSGPMVVAETGDAVAPAMADAIRCDATCTHGDEAHAARDRKTSPALRRRVRLRDGNRCRCCGSRHGLMVHHIRFRSQGGATVAWNLITVCGRCHALIHEGLLVLEGGRAAAARFKTRDGAPVAPGSAADASGLCVSVEACARATASAERSADAVVTLETMPAAIDGAWWERHAHLLRNDRGGRIELRAGRARLRSAERPADPAAPDPDALSRLVGQRDRCTRLKRIVAGSRARRGCVPHLLFEGPPGTGKTTFARAAAGHAGLRVVEAQGPLLQAATDLLRVLASLREADVLFIDEIHAVPAPVLEVLYQAMAERALSLTFAQGVQLRAIRLELPDFVVFGATTERGLLADALLSRFGLVESFDYYTREDLAALADRRCAQAGVDLSARGARRLAAVSRGVPREVLRLTERTIDLAAERSADRICREDVDRALHLLGIDRLGLTPVEQRCVRVLRECSTPVPASRLARMLGMSVATLTRCVEPFLFRTGLLAVTPRGRRLRLRPRLLEA